MSYASPRRLSAYRAPFADMTLGAALKAGAERRWAGRRIYKTGLSQGRTAILTIVPLIRSDVGGRSFEEVAGMVTVREVTQEVVLEAIRIWSESGTLAAGTINSRINALSVMGVNVEGLRQRLPKFNGWWLTEEKRQIISTHFRRTGNKGDLILADYVDWTVHTGLRVEESLRLQRRHFSTERIDGQEVVLVTVPGLKTSGSQASLPLASQAAAIFKRRLGRETDQEARLFPVCYDQLNARWSEARRLIGESGHPLATLKALRRTAARNLTTGGMPLDLLRHYLRHESVATTMHYLRLTGGYSSSEFTRYLR